MPYYPQDAIGAGMMRNNVFVPNQQYVPPQDNPYRNYFTNPYQSLQAQQPVQVPRVHGEEGARTYQFSIPNGSILLLDDTDPIVWLRMNDQLGHPNIYGYLIQEMPKQEESTASENTEADRYSDLERQISELKTQMAELEKEKNNAKSDTSGNGNGRNANNGQRSNGQSRQSS